MGMTLKTTEEAAEMLGVSVSMVQQMVHRGQLPVAARGKYRVVLLDDEIIEAEKQRRVRRATATLERLGYEVTLSPADR